MKNRRPSRVFQPSTARAAFTIIEITVSMVGMLIIGGIVAEIYIETQHAAQKMVQRQSAIDFAVSFTDQASDLLRGAVAPSDLDIEVQPTFTSDRFSVPAYGDPASNGLFLVTVRPSEDTESGRPFEIVREVLSGSDSGSQTVNPFGQALKDAEPKVSYRYATEARPGDVAYVDRLPSGQWPVLVEISVEVPTPGEGDEPVRMRTAVIPGRLGPIAAVAATPTPTPLPSAPLQEAQVENAPTTASAAPSIAGKRAERRAARRRAGAVPQTPTAVPAASPTTETQL